MSKIGVYPGTFDPMTKGHLNIIKRSFKIIDKLIIAIADNSNKKPLLSLDERKEIILNDLNLLDLNSQFIKILPVTGLLTDFAKYHDANCVIRGLRAVSDFEYEFQMTGMNYQLNPNLETIFLMSADNNSFISSNLVKEVHQLGGDISKFVSENTINILNKKKSQL